MRYAGIAVLTILVLPATQLALGQDRHAPSSIARADVSESSDAAPADSNTDLEDCLQPDGSLPPLPEDSVGGVHADYCYGYCKRCKPLRVEGDSIPSLNVGKSSPGKLRMVPDFKCCTNYAYAGMSMDGSQQLAAFSADSKSFIRCNYECEIIDVATGSRVATAKKQRQGVDGSPISEDSAIAPVLSKLGAPAEEGHWPYDELILTWSITQDCRAVTVYLVETSTGIERAVARVVDDRFMVLPSHVVLSPDSRWLAVIFKKIGGPPYFWEPVLVDVHKAAATLFAKVADARGKDNAFIEKAREACRRSR